MNSNEADEINRKLNYSDMLGGITINGKALWCNDRVDIQILSNFSTGFQPFEHDFRY